jgi:radical SAM superfamily enzyme YgiQ (UPF0313 family)
MMKILLISPNIEFLPDPIFPLGLANIAGVLKENGISHRILDLCFVEDFKSAVTSEITRYQPDLIGLSLRNLDNVSYPNYMSYLPFYRKLIQIIRKNVSSRIVVGGSAFALMPEEILNDLNADFGVAGEGERGIMELIRRIQAADKQGIGVTERIVWDRDVGMVQNLDELPFPDRSGLDNDAYLQYGGMGNIQTKRGCPFRCIYCTYPIIEGKNVRLRSPKKICDEIEDLLKHGIKNLFIVDNEFNFPVEHAQFVCHEMIRRKLKIKWSGYANPKFITGRLVDLMKNSGCTGIEFGSDSADPVMLANMGKDFTVDDMIRASEICTQAGLSFCHSLLIGGPGETMESVKRSFHRVVGMSPTAVICMVGIRIFPKTRLFQIAEKEEKIVHNQNLLEPAFYISPAIEDKILAFIASFSKDHPTWIFPGMNININRALQEKIRRIGAKGPLWEYMRLGQRFKKQ